MGKANHRQVELNTNSKMEKSDQKKILTSIIEADEKDGLYDGIVDQDKKAIDLVRCYQSKLNEVLETTGKITYTDIDYCMLLSLHDQGYALTKK